MSTISQNAFSDIFPKQLGIFSPNFSRLLNIPIYAGLQIVMQLFAILMKLSTTPQRAFNGGRIYM